MINPFEILGVTPLSHIYEIKAAFRGKVYEVYESHNKNEMSMDEVEEYYGQIIEAYIFLTEKPEYFISDCVIPIQRYEMLKESVKYKEINMKCKIINFYYNLRKMKKKAVTKPLQLFLNGVGSIGAGIFLLVIAPYLDNDIISLGNVIFPRELQLAKHASLTIFKLSGIRTSVKFSH